MGIRGRARIVTAGLLLAGVLVPRLSYSAVKVTYSDANFVNSFREDDRSYSAYDFNRFRSEITANDAADRFAFNSTVDVLTYISRPLVHSSFYRAVKDPDPDLPFNPYLNIFRSDDALGRVYFYRINARVAFEHSQLVVGLQRIPFGAGRLWNPTDTFNPVDALSIEPAERAGVFAFNYTHYLSDFSFLELVTNLKKKGEVDKYGFRYKGHHADMDMGISFIQNGDFWMTGAEFESNLLDTGVEVRGEFAFFDNQALDKTYFSGVTGFEYAFPFNLTLLAEYFYNGLGTGDEQDYNTAVLVNGNWNLGRHYLGAQLSYQWTPLATLAVSVIGNLADQSIFTGPSISYSVNDETTLSAGANIFSGPEPSEFGSFYDNYFYVKLETFF